MAAASSADVNAKFVAERGQPSLERANDARRDAEGMPVHAHHAAKGTRKDWPAAAATRRVRSGGQWPPTSRRQGARHPVGQPSWNATPVQRQISAASSSRHPFSILSVHKRVGVHGRRVEATRENGPPRSAITTFNSVFVCSVGSTNGRRKLCTLSPPKAATGTGHGRF
jgi:hypothetical protein